MLGSFFAGDLYVALYTDEGVNTGFNGPINGTSVAIQVQDAEEKTRTSMMEASYGQALDSVMIPKPQKLTIKFDDQPPSLMALGLGGTVEDYSQAAVTAQAVSVVARLGKWVNLGYRNVTAVIDAASTPVILPDVDFVFDGTRGFVKFLSTSTEVNEGDTVALKVTAKAVTASRILGSTKPTFYASIMLDGVNKANGKRGRLHIDKVNMAPSGDVDPLSGEFMVTTLKGTMITLDGESAPYRWDTDSVYSA